MSIQNQAATIQPPSLKRVKAVVIDAGGSATLNDLGRAIQENKAYVEIIVMGCEPLLDAEGNPVLSEFGMPLYTDQPGWVASKRITGEALMPYLSLFEAIWTPAEAEAVGIDVSNG